MRIISAQPREIQSNLAILSMIEYLSFYTSKIFLSFSISQGQPREIQSNLAILSMIEYLSFYTSKIFLSFSISQGQPREIIGANNKICSLKQIVYLTGPAPAGDPVAFFLDDDELMLCLLSLVHFASMSIGIEATVPENILIFFMLGDIYRLVRIIQPFLFHYPAKNKRDRHQKSPGSLCPADLVNFLKRIDITDNCGKRYCLAGCFLCNKLVAGLLRLSEQHQPLGFLLGPSRKHPGCSNNYQLSIIQSSLKESSRRIKERVGKIGGY